MSKLTKQEREWLNEVQAVLNKCPSYRLGFYTTGDSSVTVFDDNKAYEINSYVDNNRVDYCTAAHAVDALLGFELHFPNQVLSTAG